MQYVERIPLYKQLYENILQNIENKAYVCCQKLPSENAFAKEFDVNRHTVRKALQLLKDDGFIYSKKGKGNFISDIKVPYKITDKSNYSTQILDLGYEPKTELLSVECVYPSADVITHLDLREKEQALALKLLRFANDAPIALSVSYFQERSFKNLIPYLKEEPFSLYKALKKAYPFLQITKEQTVFEASTATKEQAELLKMPLSSPILKATTLSRDQNGKSVEYGASFFRGDMCKIKVDLV